MSAHDVESLADVEMGSQSAPNRFTASVLSTARTSWTLVVTITLSGSLTLLNKAIYDKFKYGYPFYLLMVHFGAIAVTSRIIAQYARPKQFAEYSERVGWGFWSRNVLPVGLLYGGAILASNLAYLSLSVSFVQILYSRGTGHCDNGFGATTSPIRTAVVVLIISCGVATAAYGEIHFVLLGVLFQVVGSVCEVGRLIATQRLLQDLQVDPLVALSQLSPICFAMALVLAPIFEGFDPIFLLIPRLGVLMILLSMGLALALNIAVLFLVSTTSALVLTLAGIVKDICIISGSVFFLGSRVTSTQTIGYGIAACGLLYFRFSGGSQSSGEPKSAYEAVPMMDQATADDYLSDEEAETPVTRTSISA